ncbi:MAG: hypothetical protein AB1716_17865, partial [Planctomycetota bacterium]
ALRGVPGSCGVESAAGVVCDERFRIVGVKLSTDDIDPLDQLTIEQMLGSCQIAGPGLVELRAWHWLYAHSQATAAELRDAVVRIAGEVWREFYEPYFGPDRYHLAAAYQHMLGYPLYMANYALSGIAMQQIRVHVRGKPVAEQMLRLCTIGRLSPDIWMERFVGAPLSAEPLVRDTERVLERLRARR